MRTKKALFILFTLFIVTTAVLAACDNKGNESQPQESSTDTVSVSNENSKEDNSKTVSKSDTSKTVSKEESLPPIENEPTKYLSVLGCTLTDKNSFVIVGKCEEGATITATTATQNVSATSDKGYYSVRLKKESTKTRVTLEAKGTITEKFALDAKPIVPTSDMWPIVGGDNYNFFFQKMMPDFEQTNTLSDSQINSVTTKMKNRISALKEASPNTKIIYMIVPSKASIYPELVPADYKKGTGKSRLEQVNAALKDGGATVIDLLSVFNQHKNDQYKLYWNTDSHWTDYGAFVAYSTLFDYISGDFIAAAPRTIDEFNFKEDYYEGGDMIYYMMMKQKELMEYCCYRTPKFNMDSQIAGIERYRSATYLMYNQNTVVPEITFETKRSNLPDLYVMRDSYSTQIYDILAERGNTTYYKAMWDYSYNIGDITEKQPDYIIYILSEWNIDSVIGN